MEVISRAVLRILIVEDDADAADSMAMVLRLYGYDVDVAGDGPTALQKADDAPDVVMLDIGMPLMDGWGVAKELRQRRTKKRPLIIAVTGRGHKEARLRSYEAGIDVHFVKPVDPAELANLLRRYQKIVMRVHEIEVGSPGNLSSCQPTASQPPPEVLPFVSVRP
jgi:DNA-binding response OmpR family regulator